jgi:glycosyltransferase involved in cell wall biosynthesis
MKFSIILPTYNRAELFLKRAIDSVVRQSYKDWELIIVDNNSTDSTKDLVGSYSGNNIRLYSIQNEGNIAKSRNLGISKAKGEFIAFLDSDDYWRADKLEKCISILKNNPGYDGVCHAEYWIDAKRCQQIRKYGPERYFNYKQLLVRGNSVSLSAMIVNRDNIITVKSFSENREMITAEDYDLWIKLAKNNTEIFFTNEPLGYYQIHEDSESSNISRNTKAIIYVIESHLKDQKKILNKALANCWKNTGKQFYLNCLNYESYRSYLKSLKYNCMNIKIYLLILTTLVPAKFYKYIVNKKND